ncbi:hypothetical protein MPH_12964 [Macrophomina phaseolina MS6]|uniref:Uncharacterized protein n=1 Tax=Macrophomina phaseolina (strain MS6) TaxID=1126212 RepID=K2RZU3_MACPH|nr:hypothetical protein MPH_12964 [Macrophomina phaseolina MS6]
MHTPRIKAMGQSADTSSVWMRWSVKDALIHFNLLKASAFEMEESDRDPIEALKKDLNEESGMGNKLDEYNACMAGAEAALRRIEAKDNRLYSTFEDIPEDSLYYDEAFNLYRTFGRLANNLLARTWYKEDGCSKNYSARWFLRHYMQTRISAHM